MSIFSPESVVAPSCTLGEGPVWDSVNSRLLWVDIPEGNIHEWHPRDRRHEVTHVGVNVGAIALDAKDGLVAATARGFARVCLDDGLVRYIADPESHLSDNRFNDGKSDPAGRFWAGTMDEVNNTPQAGKLYALEHDGSVSLKIPEVSCSNGMAWSLDNRVFYHIDTPTREVTAYDYANETGAITNRRVTIVIPEEDGAPDGMTIDIEGMLWIACWGGWKVARWNPHTGQKLMEINLPVSLVTCCTFGGDSLNDLYITTAKGGLTDDELAAQPLAGSLFVVRNMRYTGREPFRVIRNYE